ncbi:MAG TPA: septal ring lytic transglycosylase RlpA family protein [Terracidiphilus sp.]|nr:septal ring lytic transglycosylase RlpA family protein [Terracidiphilus sp.]
MVERQKSRNLNGKRSVWFWVSGAALSLTVATVFFADSTLTVQADTPLARPAATLPPSVPKDIETGIVAAPAKKPAKVFEVLKGIATWYGRVLNGHHTASGERFNMMAMTCAHKSLPFGTVVRVVDLDTNKSVVVRVNDRGELPGNHVVDLSYGAARELGTLKSGVANVRLEIIGKAKP